jgi:hypothetical protein
LWEKESLQIGLGKRNEIGPLFYTTYKNQFKWVTDLNARPRSIKFLEENIVEKEASLPKHWSIVLAMVFIGRDIKSTGDNTWDPSKLSYFLCPAKEMIRSMER